MPESPSVTAVSPSDGEASTLPLTRRPDLDALRVVAFALLILYHVGLFYVSWSWHVKSPHASTALEPLMLLLNPWRLTLLFVVSGAATRFMADKLPAPTLAAQRVKRLLIPLVFGALVMIPPQAYVEALTKGFWTGDYWSFWPAFITGQGAFRGAGVIYLPPTGHLWFVSYVLAYTLAVCLLLAVAPGLLRWTERAADWLATRTWRLLVLPVAYMAVLKLALEPVFGVTHVLGTDWYSHPLWFASFLFGYGMARSAAVAEALVAQRRAGLWLFGVGALVHVGSVSVWRGLDAMPLGVREAAAIAFCAQAWGAVVAGSGYARRWVTRSGRRLRYLTEAVFPFYIVHQTAIVLIAYGLLKLSLPLPIEAALLIGGTVATCFATYELVRRVEWLRPLFGLKRRAPPQAAAAAPASASLERA